MAGNRINKEQIFKLAKEIAFNGQLPTALKIRAKLTSGSMVTIQKYLQEWKKECFKNAFSHKELNLGIHNSELIEKNRVLEQILNKKTAQIEHYIKELIDAEKKNIALKEEINQLQTSNQKLLLSLNAAEAANIALDKVIQNIQNNLDLHHDQTIQKMQQTIDNLMLELKTLNENSIAALRETSNQGHEALMQEKVNSINLQTKIDILTKELLQSKKQLHEAIMISQVQNRSLSRKNEELQKIIQEHGLSKSPQLDESSLLLANGVAAYGK